MKRPQGFDRPAAGERAAGAPQPDAAAPSAARGGRAPARRGAGRAADSVTTEPIAVVTSTFVPMTPAPPASASAGPATVEPAADPALAAGTGGGDAGTSPGAARRNARRAAAAARRFERAEVRRFTQRSRRRRLSWTLGVGAVVLVVGGLVGAAYSPLMALREIRVEGAAAVPADSIRQALQGELGTPLPMLDEEAVHAALSSFNLVERYSTELVPPGTLVVRIVERSPIGWIEGNGGWDLVDAAGVVISHAGAPAEGGTVLDVGQGIASDEFAAVGAVIHSLPDSVRSQLATATATSPADVRLTLASGAGVVWGDATQAALKADVLAALMRSAPPDFAGQYDVSAPMSPVTY